MSVQATNFVLERVPYRGSRLTVAFVLADHADPEGKSIFPSVLTVAIKARLKVRATQQALSVLEADGVFVREVGGSGRGNRPRWFLEMDSTRWTAAAQEKMRRIAPSYVREKVREAAQKGAKPRVQKVHGGARKQPASILMNHQRIRQEPNARMNLNEKNGDLVAEILKRERQEKSGRL